MNTLELGTVFGNQPEFVNPPQDAGASKEKAAVSYNGTPASLPEGGDVLEGSIVWGASDNRDRFEIPDTSRSEVAAIPQPER